MKKLFSRSALDLRVNKVHEMQRFDKNLGELIIQNLRVGGKQETFSLMVSIPAVVQNGRYRNQGGRFGLRFNLIAGIHNFELPN